ncbi:MAG: tRNA lysidine(34) synthetase TilS [Candidatus Cloacimonadota bacterium]|nr:MAG: tRNA lysidine(34) synthetase TilS [Candidatus Cloacimonadota bacterium]
MTCNDVRVKVLHYIKDKSLIESGERILVAVSGGPDSMLLMHILNGYKSELNISLVCCHVNHQLRDVASNRDELFVRNVCRQIGVPFVSKRINVSALSKEKHISIEDAARQLRLGALYDIAEERKCQKIGVGHTSDDTMETFILNILRGTGRKGLSGIHPKRGKFIHPLLCLKKREVLHYLKNHHIDYQIDVTNWRSDNRRNFIRRELVPLIEKKFNKRVKDNILQLIKIIIDEEDLLSTLTGKTLEGLQKERDEGIVFDRDSIKALHPAIQRRILIRSFEKLAGEMRLNFKEIEALRTAIISDCSGMVFPYHGIIFLIGANSILVRVESRKKEVREDIHACLSIPGSIRFQNRYLIKTTVLEQINGNIDSRDCVYYDLDLIQQPLIIRTRNNGDTFIPFGMHQKKKVKEFFIDAKVPFWERDEIPIIADEKGILWIAGLRRADSAKVRKDTERILKIEKRYIG